MKANKFKNIPVFLQLFWYSKYCKKLFFIVPTEKIWINAYAWIINLNLCTKVEQIYISIY